MGAQTTLYLRSIPAEVVREAKAAAARRGVTLAAFAADALAKAAESLPDAKGITQPSLEEDMKWFAENKAELLKNHEGCYIAIIGGEVVDTDNDFGSLATRVFRKFGNRPVFMPRCTAEEHIYKVRSPRVAGRNE